MGLGRKYPGGRGGTEGPAKEQRPEINRRRKRKESKRCKRVLHEVWMSIE